jgi:predicted Zn-dependent protease
MNARRLFYAINTVMALFLLSCENGNGQKDSSLPKRILYSFAAGEGGCGDPFGPNCMSKEEDVLYKIGSAEAMILKNFEIDPNDEKEIGDKFHAQMDFQYIEDQRTRKLRSVLGKLKPFAQRKEVDYRVFLIENEEINAWTIPGGNIYVTTAMMANLENDDELAIVLGHEIGHNECKHTHRQLQRYALAKAPFEWMKIEVDPSMLVDFFSTLAVAFSQYQELEADRTGFIYSANAGYDPKRGLEFWKRLAEKEQENDFERFFRSHPYSSARYTCGSDYLDEHRKK